MGGDITREVWSIISHPTVLDPFTESIKSLHMCEVSWCRCVQERFCRLRTLRARGSQSKQANTQNKHPVQRFRGQASVWLYSQLWVQVVVCKCSLWRLVFRYFIRSWVRARAGPAYFGQGVIPPVSSYLFKVSGQNVFCSFFCCLLSIIQNVNWIVWHLCWLLLSFYVGTNHHSMVLTCEAWKTDFSERRTVLCFHALYLLNCKWMMMMMEDMLARF